MLQPAQAIETCFNVLQKNCQERPKATYGQDLPTAKSALKRGLSVLQKTAKSALKLQQLRLASAC